MSLPPNLFTTPPGDVPPNYREVLYWRITQSKARIVFVNLLAVLSAGVFGFFFFWFVQGLLPADSAMGSRKWLALIGALILTLIAHELAHGIAMRACGARPRYGVLWQALVVYATAPGYAFTRDQYLVVALAPLVSLSLLAMLGMLLFAGSMAVALLVVCATLNAAGAAGDMWIVTIVARYPEEAYVIDERDGFRIFLPA